ncbi:unnamed protein product [Soboliphyme baturini]|uniref:Endo/exonuclease/phosphatase domain-containing protein n=1 Tax=Soboliphyme baturini TaxID=241478 RepID=A0A183J991_9BILA|nr:unnamed protein product [Soboliphyme baturini]
MKLWRFSAYNGLLSMNTFFEHRRVHQHAWYLEARAHNSIFDLIIISSDLKRSAMDVPVKRGAELSTDHHLLVRTLRYQKWSITRRPGRRSNHTVKWETLYSADTTAKFANNIARRFEQIPAMTTDVEKEWHLFKSAIIEADAECYKFKPVGRPPGGQKRSSWWT